MSTTAWDSYEQVATYLINQIASEFGLEKVEAKQQVAGRSTGACWEIDAKGIRLGNEGFVIVECRRYTTKRLNQEHLAALAFRIHDTGAAGGIVVSPLGLQEGARRVAAAANVQNVILRADSTPTEYFMRFLNRVMIGTHDALSVTESAELEVRDVHGNVIRRQRLS